MEKIYTIPVNEAFSKSAEDKSCGCAMCSLERMLEANELDIILGAAMMEPDIRIKTNRAGFCARHYDKMFEMKNRLGLALMLESHLDEWKEKLKPGGIKLPRHLPLRPDRSLRQVQGARQRLPGPRGLRGFREDHPGL